MTARSGGPGPTLGVVALLLFSGCVGGSSTAKATLTKASVTADIGALEGTVLDEEQAPVAGASVGIRNAGGSFQNQTNTSAAGAFSFSGLEPGAYTIEAQSPFYQGATSQVTIAAGQITKATLLVKKAASLVDGVVDTFPKKGYIACSVAWTAGANWFAANPCQDVLANVDHFKVPMRTDLPLKEVVLELVWQAGSGFSGTSLQMILCSEKDATTSYYGQCVTASGTNPYYQWVSGHSPQVLRRGDLPLKTVKTFTVAVGDGGTNSTDPRPPVTFQQNFDLYMTLCYNQNCTADFRARPPT